MHGARWWGSGTRGTNHRAVDVRRQQSGATRESCRQAGRPGATLDDASGRGAALVRGSSTRTLQSDMESNQPAVQTRDRAPTPTRIAGSVRWRVRHSSVVPGTAVPAVQASTTPHPPPPARTDEDLGLPPGSPRHTAARSRAHRCGGRTSPAPPPFRRSPAGDLRAEQPRSGPGLATSSTEPVGPFAPSPHAP